MWLFGKRNESFLPGRLCSVVSREEWICHCCRCYLILWDNASSPLPNNSNMKVLEGSFLWISLQKMYLYLPDRSPWNMCPEKSHLSVTERDSLKLNLTLWHYCSANQRSSRHFPPVSHVERSGLKAFCSLSNILTIWQIC